MLNSNEASVIDTLGLEVYVEYARLPFLWVNNANGVFCDGPENIITTSTGWLIHEYGTDCLFVHSLREKSELMEQIATAAEVACLMAKKQWSSIMLNTGTKIMKRFIWMESKRYGISIDTAVSTYTPNKDDEKHYAKLVKYAEDNGFAWEKQVQPFPDPAEGYPAGARGA